jgi:6-phosphogluconolactonase
MLSGSHLVLPDPQAVAQKAADLVALACDAAIAQHGRFTLVLAGGSTPKLLYQLLAKRTPALDWSRVHLFFGDERCVPHTDSRSNMLMVHESLAQPAGVPHSNIFAFKTHLPPDQAAADYEATLRAHFSTNGPDMVLLGMGADGHTLSLFPGDNAAIEEHDRWCLHTIAPAPFAVPDRVTVTLPFVHRAKARLFMVTGADKAARIAAIVAGREMPPAACVQNATWLCDQAAG